MPQIPYQPSDQIIIIIIFWAGAEGVIRVVVAIASKLG
jgi:hypothetical protein